MNKEHKEIVLMILIFLSVVPSIIFLLMGIRSLNIYIQSENYKLGILKVKSIDCGNSHGGDDSNCYAYGLIDKSKILYRVNLGLSPDKTKLFEKTKVADLSKTEYDVYYIRGKKMTILKDFDSNKLKTNYYLKRAISELFFPILVFPFLIYCYNKNKT